MHKKTSFLNPPSVHMSFAMILVYFICDFESVVNGLVNAMEVSGTRR